MQSIDKKQIKTGMNHAADTDNIVADTDKDFLINPDPIHVRLQKMIRKQMAGRTTGRITERIIGRL